MIGYIVLGLVVCAAVHGVPISEKDNEINDDEPGFFKNFEKCTSHDDVTEMMNCAASRMLKTIEKASYDPIIKVMPGITLESNGSISMRQAKELSEEPLPTDPHEKTNKLADLLLNATQRFFEGKTLKVQLPVLSKDNVARALEEGRGKMKKMVGPWMLGLGATMITMIPIMMGGLSILAAKALMIGKVALVVSAILFAQYFFQGRNIFPAGWPNFSSFTGGYGSGYGSGYGAYGTNNIGGWSSSAQYPYARSLNVTPKGSEESSGEKQEGTDLAYSAHVES